MKTLTTKVFSLCSDFDPNAGHQEMYDDLSAERGYDCFIEYTAMTPETQVSKGYSFDAVAARLCDLGAIDQELVLIHIDY